MEEEEEAESFEYDSYGEEEEEEEEVEEEVESGWNESTGDPEEDYALNSSESSATTLQQPEYEPKPFLGGYYSTKTGVEFHHATTNTESKSPGPKPRGEDVGVQTIKGSNKGIQTRRDSFQQCDRVGYYSSERNQRIIYSKPYVDSEQMECARNEAVIVIQKYWRRWLAIKERRELMSRIVNRVQWTENTRKGRTDERMALKDNEIERQHNPTRMEDIEFLYRAITDWKNEQIAFVEAHRWGPERKAALALIAEQEADLLLDLERTKANIRDNLRDETIDLMGNPSRWMMNKRGDLITVDDPAKARARCLHLLYTELKGTGDDSEERKDILEKLYETIRDYKSPLTDQLIDLMKREIIFIDRHMGKSLLAGVRQRILSGFLNLCRDENFNPQAVLLGKIPFEMNKLRKEMLHCTGCKRILHRDQFANEKGIKVSKKCLRCVGIYRHSILREASNLYNKMLNELRIDEQKLGVKNSIALLIDVLANDLKFLIDQIWLGQSAISGVNDKYLLRMCRWDKNEPWTPWNSILLTEEECLAHLNLDSLIGVYQAPFNEQVKVKHNAAKIYFGKSTKLEEKFDSEPRLC